MHELLTVQCDESLRFYGNRYLVSTKGKVISVKAGRELKPRISYKGYERLELYGKEISIHRLISLLFIPNKYCKPQVDHINGDKADNRAENLRWVTNKENCNYYLQAKREGRWNGRYAKKKNL